VEVESTKARRAYDDYLADGPDRSLAKLAEKYGKSTAYVRQLERWSSLYGWHARADVHDEVVRQGERAARAAAYQAARQAKADQRRAAREQRLAHGFAVASSQRAVVLKRLNRLLANEKQLDELTVKDIIALTAHINVSERALDADDDRDVGPDAGVGAWERVDMRDLDEAELRALAGDEYGHP